MGTRREPLRFVCKSCGAERETINTGNRGIFCNRQCRADHARKGKAEPCRYLQNGYWMLRWTEPGGTKRSPVRRFQFEHRAVWEKHNGPIPDGHVIHHLNEIKTDNRIENLHLMRRGDHVGIHAVQPDKYPGGGTASAYAKRWRDNHPEYAAVHAQQERERRARRKVSG